MDDSDREEYVTERIHKLGYKPQREIYYNRLLPYWDELDDESAKILADIKENLARAILGREMRPGIGIWTSRLMRYMKVYGLKFSKEDHIELVHLVYKLCVIPNLEPTKLYKFATLLVMLLKKKELLTRSDLTLEWRPLYDLCVFVMLKGTVDLGMYRYFSTLDTSLEMMVNMCKHYFPLSATREILDEVTPKLSPFDATTMEEAVELLTWFLPVTLPPEHHEHGFKLWFSDLMSLWTTCHNSPKFEHELMNLIASLAPYTIGYIDWEPYIPLMFTRFLRCFNFPVSFKKRSVSKGHLFDTSSIAVWIVSVLGPKSSAQKYLNSFMETVESYLHPANAGAWVHKLRNVVSKLPYYFVQRVSKERYKRLKWETPTPEEYKLTDEDITQFVECIKPVAMQTMFSTIPVNDQTQIMQNLALLRPNLVIPMLVDKMYATLHSLTEPHKLTACMISMVAVARPLVQGFTNGYTEGPTHVIPLLFATLPGIDPNDFKKSLVTSHFITIFAMLIPIVDCSKASEFYELTEEEHIVCEATAGLEDFMLQFLDRVFQLIESSSFEMTRTEQRESDTGRTRLESLTEAALASTTIILLMQSSNEIFRSALRKMHEFVSTRILETKVSGPFAASMCRAFARVNSKETLKMFTPHLCENIIQCLSEHENYQNEEKLDNELLYNMLILSEIVECNGTHLMKYIDILTQVLDKTLHLHCKEGSILANRILKRIFLSFCNVMPIEFKSSPNIGKPLDEFLPIRDWGGTPAKMKDANLTWHMPTAEEIECVKNLVHKYLPPELDKIDKYAEGSLTLSREDLQRTLDIVIAILSGSPVFPMWNETPIRLLDSILPNIQFLTTIGIKHAVNMPDGSNVRQAIIKSVHNLQRKLLTSVEDDTKSLVCIIQIWDLVLTRKARTRDFETLQKNFQVMKRVLEDRLTGKKMHLRSMLVDRVVLQHEYRMDAQSNAFTPTHHMILLDMLELSTSYYSIVRINAQVKLSPMLNAIAYSYLAILPKLVEYLQSDTKTQHERFKGVLYVLLGPKPRPLICKYDWVVISQLWPTLLKSQMSEKLSVIRLLDSVVDTINKHFPTISISIEFPDELIESALSLLATTEASAKGDGLYSVADINTSLANLEKCNRDNLDMYNTLLDDILQAILSGNLHWRYQNLAMSFLRDLVHIDVKYPAHVVRYFVNTLINDSLDLRKLAICTMVFVLKQQKQEHKKVVVDPYKLAGVPHNDKVMPGDRPDNQWLQYNSKTVPNTPEQWDELRYIHSPNIGFYKWPRELMLYAPSSEQPKLTRNESELNDVEKEIHSFFSQQKNIDKLIGYLSLEDKKGADKFNGHRFIMFKGLFRNHGDTYLPLIMPHLQRLVADRGESQQRCAAEIIAGIIRGAKHWPFHMAHDMWGHLVPLIRTALGNITPETVSDWGICFATSAEHIDPSRNHWLYEVLMETPLRSEASFIDCGRLYALQGVLNQHLWRCSELFTRLLEYFKPFLMHPFENVRERLGSVLTNIFDADLLFPAGNRSNSPHISAMMAYVFPQLQILNETNGTNNIEHEVPTSSIEKRPSISTGSIEKRHSISTASSEKRPSLSSAYIEKRHSISTSSSIKRPSVSTDKRHSISVEPVVSKPDIKIAAAKPNLNMVNEVPIDTSSAPPPPRERRLSRKSLDGDNSAMFEKFHAMEMDAIVFNADEDVIDNINSNDTERDVAVRLFKTVTKWIMGSLSRSNYGARIEYFQLLPLACRLENSEQDPELGRRCSEYIAMLGQAIMLPAVVPHAIIVIKTVSLNTAWWARCNILDFLQVLVFHNMSTFLSQDKWVEEVRDVVLRLLGDERLEVREKAGQVLGGLLHCDFIPRTQELLDDFKLKSKTKLKRKRNSVVSLASANLSMELNGAVLARHTAVLGMCAFIAAHPYAVPAFMPDVFAQLGAHLNDPQPIPSTIRKTLGDFKRTHHDNWDTHQLKFTEDQLAVLSELTIPPSYYA